MFAKRFEVEIGQMSASPDCKSQMCHVEVKAVLRRHCEP